jgi:hypothetical protein
MLGAGPAIVDAATLKPAALQPSVLKNGKRCFTLVLQRTKLKRLGRNKGLINNPTPEILGKELLSLAEGKEIVFCLKKGVKWRP